MSHFLNNYEVLENIGNSNWETLNGELVTKSKEILPRKEREEKKTSVKVSTQ